MRLYKKILLIFTAFSLIFMTSCNEEKTQNTNTHADVIPSKLTIGMYCPDSYNPLDTKTVYNEQAYFLMYDSLFNISESYEPVKNLATDLTIENGGKTATLQIKPNVKFHNGEILKARHIANTINYILKNGGFYAYNVRNIEAVKIINDYTLQLSLKYSTPNIALQLTFPIISENNFNGTGPYKLLNEKKGKQLDLIKFEEYHNKFNSQVNKVEINLIPDKITARSLSGSGILDIFFAAYSDEGLKTVTKSRSVKRDYLTDSYVFLKLNFNNPLLFLKSFRKAISLGIDRKKLTDDVYMSHAEPTALPIPASARIYSQTASYEQKLQDAVSLIKDCGYEDLDSDGICEYVNYTEETVLPQTPVLNLLILNDPVQISVAESLEYDFKKLGIVLKTQKYDRADYELKYSENSYDICLVTTSNGLDLDITAFMGNGGVFSSPLEYGFENALSKLGATAIDELKEPTYTSLFGDFHENPAHIPLVFLKNTLITNDKFKDFDEIYLNNVYYKILLGKDNKDE